MWLFGRYEFLAKSFYSKVIYTKNFFPWTMKFIKISCLNKSSTWSVYKQQYCVSFMCFSISPGRMLFCLYNCCYVWTRWWRFSSVMKISSYFRHRYCLLWLYFFSCILRLFLSDLHLRVAVPLRTLWCVFRSLLCASITSLSQDVYMKDVYYIYLIWDIKYISYVSDTYDVKKKVTLTFK